MNGRGFNACTAAENVREKGLWRELVQSSIFINEETRPKGEETCLIKISCLILCK